jgi:hypothetical protein
MVCRYKPTDLVVTENGVDVPGEYNASFPDVLNDEFRINYFKGYIQAAADAVVEDKVSPDTTERNRGFTCTMFIPSLEK